MALGQLPTVHLQKDVAEGLQTAILSRKKLEKSAAPQESERCASWSLSQLGSDASVPCFLQSPELASFPAWLSGQCLQECPADLLDELAQNSIHHWHQQKPVEVPVPQTIHWFPEVQPSFH